MCFNSIYVLLFLVRHCNVLCCVVKPQSHQCSLQGRVGADTMNADELKAMITYGLKDIWDDDNSTIRDEDIDAVLSRAKVFSLSLSLCHF